METALDVLSRAATMVQDNANETRLTTKELPTTDWRRKRRARAGEYVHAMGNNSPLNVLANASPPCSPGATIPTAVAHRVHFYPHVPAATRYPALHYQTMPAHHAGVGAAVTVPLVAPVSSITSPSPSPTSSTSSLSQTSLLMAGNLQQQSTTYAPQAHRSSAGGGPAAAAAAADLQLQVDEQNLDHPLDMTVSSALLKQQRESPPPPYREPLPGSCYMAALARPSVITQAPPKRKEEMINNGINNELHHLEGNEGVKSIVIKTPTSADDNDDDNNENDNEQHDPTASLCETVIDEHFRRSLGADYLALFANKKSTTLNDHSNNNYYEQPAPLQLTTTTKSSTTTTPPPPTPLPTPSSPVQQIRTMTPTEEQTQIPVTTTAAAITTTIEQTLTTSTTTLSTDGGISETKRYGKHKIAYMQQKSNQNYYQQQQQQPQQQVETATTTTITTTTDEALSLIQPKVVTPSIEVVKKKTCNNIVVKIEPHAASICDSVCEDNSTTMNVKATSPTSTSSSSNATISEEASVDDHFAKALGDKWKELQTSKNLRK